MNSKIYFMIVLALHFILIASNSDGQQAEIDELIWKEAMAKVKEKKASLNEYEKKLNWHIFAFCKELEKQKITKYNYELSTLQKKYHSPIMQIDDQARVLCHIWTRSNSPLNLRDINDIKIVKSREDYNFIVAYIPFYAMLEVAKINEVYSITPVLPDFFKTGNINSEGDAILNADDARQLYGVSGEGVRIGVISDGINPNGNPIINDGDLGIADPELPPVVIDEIGLDDPGPQLLVMDNRLAGNTAEGTAMLEIIHDLCPEADLLFHFGSIGGGTFDEAINNLANAGCDIIVDDMGNILQPYFQDNAGISAPIYQAINNFVINNNGLYFSSVGNSSEEHYEDQYSDDDTDNVHNFSASDEALDFEIRPGGAITIHLQWSNEWDNATTDIDAQLWERDILGDDLVAEDLTNNIGGHPFISLHYTNPGTLNDAEIYLRIIYDGGPTDVRLEIYWTLDEWGAEGSNLADNQFLIREGSSFGHPVFENTIAIGAIQALRMEQGWPDNAPYEEITSYSSYGPCRIYTDFTTQQFVERIKPDITAIDGIHVSGAFGFGYDQDGSHDPLQDDPATPNLFFGTSASAPHAAAVAGLIKSGNNSITNHQIKTVIQNTSFQCPNYVYSTTTGMSNETGHGRVDALGADRIGRIANMTYMFTDKFFNCYIHDDVNDGGRNPGRPIEDVVSDWNGYEKQEFENGAIIYKSNNSDAYWLGEGIYNKWSEAYILTALGAPVSNEYLDPNNSNYPTVDFENGQIYWNGSEAIVVMVQVTANFEASPLSGNAPLTVQFTDLSIAQNTTITNWHWDFDNNGTVDSYAQNPVYVYTEPGTYSVRLKASDGTNEDTEIKTNYITASTSVPLPNIVKVEYFFDADPGFGSGIEIPITPDDIVNVQTNISVSSLSLGLHRLYIRALDENGNWGIPQAKSVLVQSTGINDPLPNVTDVEYFFDQDPEVGNGTSFSITPGVSVEISENINVSALSLGLHRLYIRAKDASDHWGIPQAKSVLVQPTGANDPLPQIVDIEYFLDSESGMGNGYHFQFTPDTSVVINTIIPCDTLSEGEHVCYIRAKNALGLWGIPQFHQFSVEQFGVTQIIPAGNPPPIPFETTQITLDFDSGPGGEVTVQEISGNPPVAQISMKKINSIATNESISVAASRYWEIFTSMANGSYTTILKIAYDINDFPQELSEEEANILYYDPNLNEYVALATLRDTANDTLWTENYLDHLGRFALGKLSTSSVTQIIPITQGKLNMISFHIAPPDLAVNILLDDLATLLVVQDDDGKFYIPPYGVNTIGNVDLTNGYQVYITGSTDNNVENEGVPLVPQDYSQALTNTKLFMIGYPYQQPHPVVDVFASISSSVVVVQDDEGRFWIPLYGVNTIGNMQPGKGYQIYVNQTVNFAYPELTGGLAKQGESVTALSVPKHFQFEETGSPYALVVTDSKQELSVGDEVGVFDGELCVGAAVFTGEYPLVIAAWEGNEEYGLKGFKAGESISLCVWKNSEAQEVEVVGRFATATKFTFRGGPMSVMSLEGFAPPVDIPTTYGLDQNYPNPFNVQTVINYQLPKAGRVVLKIYNTLGQEVRILVDEEQKAGYYDLRWDGKSNDGLKVSSGIYVYRIQAANFVKVSKMLIIM